MTSPPMPTPTSPPPGLWTPPGYNAGIRAAELDELNARSVISQPTSTAGAGNPTTAQFMIWAISAADGFTQWGKAPRQRDAQLRDFFPTEPILASAIFTVSARNAALSWGITGDEATAEASQDMLNNANFGRGLADLMMQTSVDLYTQDNGAFIETIRSGDSPDAPVIGLAHLDAARCHQTGVPETPVIYEDNTGKFHVMQWYQVVHLLEMPTPVVSGGGGFWYRLQYSGVTRLLRGAQVMKNVSIYNEEKTGGRFTRGIHLLRGVTPDEVRQAMTAKQGQAQMAGMQRYVEPVMVGSVDVGAEVGVTTIDLATMPDGWTEETLRTGYLTLLAMALGTDYQEFAPLPGGNIGTSSQSEVLHMKSRGKGVGLFMAMITRLMNDVILPVNVEFEYTEADIEAEQLLAEARKTRAETRTMQVGSGELTPEGARQQAFDDGDMSEELFTAMGGTDITPSVVVEGGDQTGDRGGVTVSPDAVLPLGPWVTDSGDPWGGPVHRMIDGSFQSGIYASGFDIRLHPVQSRAAAVAMRERADARAARPLLLGEVLNSRMHRAATMTGDDAMALGIFPDTEARIEASSAIGPALSTFEEELKARGLWDIEVSEEDADRLLDASMRSMESGTRVAGDDEPGLGGDGPDPARLAFEEEVVEDIQGALEEVRKRVKARLAAEAAAED